MTSAYSLRMREERFSREARSRGEGCEGATEKTVWGAFSRAESEPKSEANSSRVRFADDRRSVSGLGVEGGAEGAISVMVVMGESSAQKTGDG